MCVWGGGRKRSRYFKRADRESKKRERDRERIRKSMEIREKSSSISGKREHTAARKKE